MTRTLSKSFDKPLVVRFAVSQRGKSAVRWGNALTLMISACRIFFRRAGEGEFKFTDSADLWRLMLTITLNKARMQARFHGRKRRSIASQKPIDALPVVAGGGYEEAIESVDFADFLDTVLAKLDEESQQILQRLLDGPTQEEIAIACDVANGQIVG